MQNSNTDNEVIGRMADTLYQLRDLKKLIKLHGENGSNLMMEQFEYRRKKMLKELSELLLEFEVTPTELAVFVQPPNN
ncbi:MAG: hypothetical protein K9J37_22550 [Saprospiraceae bacterium]|nr:hypothetical protein [Saprospiraceae bacterium]MCF8252705.1 hypothetical protein [Saprospiraceae bacterium]MCF8282929.1 hypothetical protein [Bacteroidales bacterium]MCF8311647.1 hypothetical protein [Saprospiraceae bacterium]MCF8440988.1 hypothetical protein [Saprospiraceae bacterium]